MLHIKCLKPVLCSEVCIICMCVMVTSDCRSFLCEAATGRSSDMPHAVERYNSTGTDHASALILLNIKES